jgi:hypothetical protein
MKPNLCKLIEQVLATGGEMKAKDIIAKVPTPEGWHEHLKDQNVSSLLAQYANKKWRRVRRGVYEKLLENK